ncbi:SIMPL domain-containing protein [Granulosicoccaceae sp. 1_MG-2023]|nr:SIMPL domain-containing protein [Granulosicoccaceae sp. 1_MG-2023]
MPMHHRHHSATAALLLGLCLLAGLALLGWQLGNSAIRYKAMERVVTVKGLAEREVPADLALWPITFSKPQNDIGALYQELAADTDSILSFLSKQGFDSGEIQVNPPQVTDKLANAYGNAGPVEFRYSASQTVMVHSTDIDKVLAARRQLAELGQQGIVLQGDNYGAGTEFLFTGLNDIKPAMIEEATRNAREVAQKFAADSNSRLGKIKTASQGQFSISNRDQQTPHIKKIRVVSTVQYYLAD